MRLAVVSPFVDRCHGTERAIAELVERLARDHGCEVHLYAQRVDDLTLSPPPTTAGSGAIIWHKVPSLPGPHLLQFLGWMFFNGLLRRWHKTFGGISCDLVLSPGINCLHPDVIIVHALFHRLRELAQAEKSRTHTHSPGSLRRLHRGLYYRMLTALERRVYSNPSVSLSAVSPRTARLLQKYFQRSDVRVIPNAVDTSHFSPAARLAKRADARRQRGFRDDEFVLLLIGNDWNTKGLPTLLQSLPSLSELPVRLLVVGSDAPQPFQSLAAEFGVSDRCVWEPPRASALDFYAAADAYVSPTHEDAFALPPLEAMACGLPIITTLNNGGSHRITHGLDGLILKDPDDRHALTNMLRGLAQQPDFCRRVGENAAHTAQQYTWDQSASELAQFLLETHRTRLRRKAPATVS